MGFTVLAIADRMGHESIDITYRYAHLFPSEQTQMAEIYEELKHLEKCSEENEELLSTLRLVAETLYGLKGENE